MTPRPGGGRVRSPPPLASSSPFLWCQEAIRIVASSDDVLWPHTVPADLAADRTGQPAGPARTGRPPTRPRWALTLVVDPVTLVPRRVCKRRHAERDDARDHGRYDPLLNILWYPLPTQSLEDLRAALATAYPDWAAWWRLGVAGGLEALSDPLAQTALRLEEYARALRDLLNRGQDPAAAPYAAAQAVQMPAPAVTLVVDTVRCLLPFLHRAGQIPDHPADRRFRSLATLAGWDPARPSWGDALDWGPPERLGPAVAVADLGARLGLPDPVWAVALARAVLDRADVTSASYLSHYDATRIALVVALVRGDPAPLPNPAWSALLATWLGGEDVS